MKTIKYIAIAVIITILAACEKDENRVYVKDNPTPPQIIAPAGGTNFVLTKDEANTNILFTWTESDYGFAASTMNQIEADIADGTFKKPQKLLTAVTYNDTALVTYNILNTAATKLKLKAGVASTLKVRVITVLIRDTLASEPINITVTPY